MKLCLFHKDSPHPWFEILDTTDGGRRLKVRGLWGNAEQRGLIYTIDKAAYRAAGYYPKEVEDAIIPELCA